MSTMNHANSTRSESDDAQSSAKSTNGAPAATGDHAVVITPLYDFDRHDTTVIIRGLTEGAHVVVDVPGVEDERHIFIGKRGGIHAFGFGKTSDEGPIRIGDR